MNIIRPAALAALGLLGLGLMHPQPAAAQGSSTACQGRVALNAFYQTGPYTGGFYPGTPYSMSFRNVTGNPVTVRISFHGFPQGFHNSDLSVQLNAWEGGHVIDLGKSLTAIDANKVTAAYDSNPGGSNPTIYFYNCTGG